jgi:hypothetical protein
MYNFIPVLSYYNSIAKPIAISTAVNGLYFAGQINGMDDILNRRKKPIYVNIFHMVKYGTFGGLIGYAFPITTPIIYIYILKTQWK